MLAIAVRYLNGWAMATDPADRSRPEWPPHPDRVFMAMVDAFFETQSDESERDALLWLERQPYPDMWASPAEERQSRTTYVPVNDATAPRLRRNQRPSADQAAAGLSLLPEKRGRQPRQFPVAIPHEPTIYLVWSEDPPPPVRAGIDALCAKVARVGHSASLVQMWLENSPPERNLTPTDGIARYRMRSPGPGRMAHLEAQYERGGRPERSRWVAYDKPQPEPPDPPPASVFDSNLIVLRKVSGDRMGLESTLLLTDRLRQTVMKHSPDNPPPEWVSGHTKEGRPSQDPHLAFLPLPFVGGDYADGHLLGLALALPRGVHPRDVGHQLNPVLGFTGEGEPMQPNIFDSSKFQWTVELERSESPPQALRPDTWTGPSRQWSTVTPLVFDRHPKGRDRDQQAEEMVARACQRIGLPAPSEVVLSQVSLHPGVPHRREFPNITRKSDGGRLFQTHAVVTFPEPVQGAVLLGAGRFRGYGMFRPLDGEGGPR